MTNLDTPILIENPRKLNIVGRINMPWAKMRAYIHGCGLPKDFSEHQVTKQAYYILDRIETGPITNIKLDNNGYRLGIIWKDNKKKMRIIDFFSFSGIDRWPGNPEVKTYTIKSDTGAIRYEGGACGDGLIILGVEETFRRRTRNLKQYLNTLPQFAGLQFGTPLMISAENTPPSSLEIRTF